MKLTLLIFSLLLPGSLLAETGVATLQELLTNTNRSGPVPLDQGYRGEFTKISEDASGASEKHQVIEFTHAWFDGRGPWGREESAPTIAIGISTNGKIAQSFRGLAAYRKQIPEFEELISMRTIKEFEKVFGVGKLMWVSGSLEEKRSSFSWFAFTPLKDGSIRVVDVVLSITDKGNGWEIQNRFVQEGVFRPTGRRPRMETR